MDGYGEVTRKRCDSCYCCAMLDAAPCSSVLLFLFLCYYESQSLGVF